MITDFSKAVVLVGLVVYERQNQRHGWIVALAIADETGLLPQRTDALVHP